MSANETLYAWGCVIVHNRVEHTFSGHSLMDKMLNHGEFFAIVQALEKLSSFDDVSDVILFTDHSPIVAHFNKLKLDSDQKHKGQHGHFIIQLTQYQHKYNLDVRKIRRTRNPAHKIAYKELLKAIQKNITEIEPPEMFTFMANPQLLTNRLLPIVGKLTSVYCDSKINKDKNIFVWSCVILHNNIQHVFSGHYTMHSLFKQGDFFSAIQALEKLSLFDVRNVILYTNDSSFVFHFEGLKKNVKLRMKGQYARYFHYLSEYMDKYNLFIYKMPPNYNPANSILDDELFESQDKPLELEYVTMLESLIPTQNDENKNEITQRGIIKEALPAKFSSELDFSVQIVQVLDKCATHERFHALLSTQGVNLSSFYQLLKNKFQKAVSYKKNGEKKLHHSFAKALSDSKFCICETNDLFFIFYKNAVPELYKII